MLGRFGVGVASLAMGAVLLTAGCGGRSVSVKPIGNGGSVSQPTVTATVTAAPNGAAVAGASTDASSGIVVSRSGSQVCVKGPRGGTACTSGHGTVVVDGVTVRDGVVVSGNTAAVSTVPPTPTKGTVRLSGVVSWSGTATGTCDGHGTGVRMITADLPGIGKLSVRNVGDGVTQVDLVAKGSPYGLNHVGGNGPVSTTDSRTVITDARLGRGNQVVLNGDFDC